MKHRVGHRMFSKCNRAPLEKLELLLLEVLDTAQVFHDIVDCRDDILRRIVGLLGTKKSETKVICRKILIKLKFEAFTLALLSCRPAISLACTLLASGSALPCWHWRRTAQTWILSAFSNFKHEKSFCYNPDSATTDIWTVGGSQLSLDKPRAMLIFLKVWNN